MCLYVISVCMYVCVCAIFFLSCLYSSLENKSSVWIHKHFAFCIFAIRTSTPLLLSMFFFCFPFGFSAFNAIVHVLVISKEIKCLCLHLHLHLRSMETGKNKKNGKKIERTEKKTKLRKIAANFIVQIVRHRQNENGSKKIIERGPYILYAPMV